MANWQWRAGGHGADSGTCGATRILSLEPKTASWPFESFGGNQKFAVIAGARHGSGAILKELGGEQRVKFVTWMAEFRRARFNNRHEMAHKRLMTGRCASDCLRLVLCLEQLVELSPPLWKQIMTHEMPAQ